MHNCIKYKDEIKPPIFIKNMTSVAHITYIHALTANIIDINASNIFTKTMITDTITTPNININTVISHNISSNI